MLSDDDVMTVRFFVVVVDGGDDDDDDDDVFNIMCIEVLSTIINVCARECNIYIYNNILTVYNM